ncbi:MAG: hypothetical protein AABZ55_12620 [Bdellovibrionota bacterium]
MGQSDENESLINPKDFQSTSIQVQFRNANSKTPLKKEANVTLTEWLEKGLVIEVPSRTCATGHSAAITLSAVRGAEKLMVVNMTVKITDVENLPDFRDRVTLSFVQYEEFEWKKLLRLFASRQDEIEDFFKKVRGY